MSRCPHCSGSNRSKKGGSVRSIINALHEGPANKPTSRFQKFLADNKDHKILAMYLGQKPIVSGVHHALDALSFGNFSRAQKHLKYDQVYHNYLLVTLSNGKTYKIEKNETVVEKTATASDYRNKLTHINLGHMHERPSLQTMVERASADTPGFWKYRGDSDNCQKFTRDMIERNHLPISAEVRKEIEPQNSLELLNTLPPMFKHIPNLVTDTAAVADRILHGDGVQKRKSRS